MLSEFIADHSRTLPVILAVEEEDSSVRLILIVWLRR